MQIHRQHTGVDGRPCASDHLESHRVFIQLRKHERVVGVESRCFQRRVMDIAPGELRGAALDEVLDPLLWRDALIEVLVPREHDADSVFDE